MSIDWTVPVYCRGLIFDCDGTLVDSMPLHYQAWVEVLGRYNIRFDEGLFYEWAGAPVKDIVQRLADAQGVPVDSSRIAGERDAYFHSMPRTSLRPVESVVGIARRFRGRLPMAVATGSTRNSAEQSLEAIGILQWFDALVTSDDVTHPKPAPDIFICAAERIGLRPEECVAFEDGDAGLQAARNAGMHAVDIRQWHSRR